MKKIFNLIPQKVEKIEEPDPLKKIEICGRVCYKSEDKITEDSAKSFVDMIMKNGHLSVLEHVGIRIDISNWIINDVGYYKALFGLKDNNKYIKIIERISYSNEVKEFSLFGNLRIFIDLFNTSSNGNLNLAILKYNLLKALKNSKVSYFFKDMGVIDFNRPELGEKMRINIGSDDNYLSFRIITSRSIANEIVRHRVFSYSQESTRYCNYNKKGISYIFPFLSYFNPSSEQYDWDREINDLYTYTTDIYNEMIKNNIKPQFAREMLPLGLKTELIMSGYKKDFKYFIKLRESERAHPMIREIAFKLKEEIENGSK